MERIPQTHCLGVMASDGRINVEVVDEIAVRYALNGAARAFIALEQLVNTFGLQ